jgi:hypothetical protein
MALQYLWRLIRELKSGELSSCFLGPTTILCKYAGCRKEETIAPWRPSTPHLELEKEYWAVVIAPVVISAATL